MDAVTTRLHNLREALDAVPQILLDEDLAVGVGDARAAVDALERLPMSVVTAVVTGPAGSGKSTIVNTLIGDDVAPVSPVRPTTETPTAYGSIGAATALGLENHTVTESLPADIVVIDTPPWDRASRAIIPLLEQADLAVMVVTPARYGDEATRENLAAASAARRMIVVVNRLPTGGGEREQLEDAVHERIGIRPAATFVEGEPIRFDVSPLDALTVDTDVNARRRVLERAAGNSSRTIAAALTEAAAELGSLERVLRSKEEPSVSLDSVNTETWETARAELVRRSIDLADTYDRSVERTADNDLARRIGASLEEFDRDSVSAALDEWVETLVGRLTAGARLGLRKRSALDLVERRGWAAAIDDSAERPKRLSRVLRRIEPETSARAREELKEILETPARERVAAWLDATEQVGSYKPGELLVAANAVDGGVRTDG